MIDTFACNLTRHCFTLCFLLGSSPSIVWRSIWEPTLHLEFCTIFSELSTLRNLPYRSKQENCKNKRRKKFENHATRAELFLSFAAWGPLSKFDVGRGGKGGSIQTWQIGSFLRCPIFLSRHSASHIACMPWWFRNHFQTWHVSRIQAFPELTSPICILCIFGPVWKLF